MGHSSCVTSRLAAGHTEAPPSSYREEGTLHLHRLPVPTPLQFCLLLGTVRNFFFPWDFTEVKSPSWSQHGSLKSKNRTVGLGIIKQHQIKSPGLWALPPLTRLIYKILHCVSKSFEKQHLEFWRCGHNWSEHVTPAFTEKQLFGP